MRPHSMSGFPLRNWLSSLLLLLLSGPLLSPALHAQTEERKQPNILFIFTDDHAFQAISCYGSVLNQTPNIDRIAAAGMRFDRCLVTNSICGPSRATILSGKY
ncbi:MAG: sulfatase-like hydrolase/transferase, partial [Planctomycetota bacterium]